MRNGFDLVPKLPGMVFENLIDKKHYKDQNFQFNSETRVEKNIHLKRDRIQSLVMGSNISEENVQGIKELYKVDCEN